MRFHSQNLNDDHRGNVAGSKFWRGRAWIYKKRGYDEMVHFEWHFGKFARDFAITMTVGYGDSDAGVCFHVCLPWLFSLFLVFPYVRRCRESQTGIKIHSSTIWICPFVDQLESSTRDPWWKRGISWAFPWSYAHYLTEILEHKAHLPGLAKTVWDDKDKKFLESYDERQKVIATVSEVYDYTYTLKNGNVQKRKATVYVDRMTWRMRWYPLLPFKKVRTSIDVSFDDEVGERTGSWKGGTIGCGYEMRLGETPLHTLRRMEQERKFD